MFRAWQVIHFLLSSDAAERRTAAGPHVGPPVGFMVAVAVTLEFAGQFHPQILVAAVVVLEYPDELLQAQAFLLEDHLLERVAGIARLGDARRLDRGGG